MQTTVIAIGAVALLLSIILGFREVKRAREAKASVAASSGPPKKLESIPPPVATVHEGPEEDITRYAPLASVPVEDMSDQFSETKALALIEESGTTDSSTGATRFFISHAVASTDAGKKRRRNEDAFAIVPQCGLYVVADGMGGYAGGDLASRLAVQTIARHFERNESPPLRKPDPNLPARAQQLVGTIESANQVILAEATKDESLHGMGTTIVAAHFLEKNHRVVIAHVGDSRCYRLRRNELKLLTTDHTLAEKGVQGPMGKHIRRAVGIKPKLYVDVLYDTPQIGDRYLLCSDGLTKMVTDATLKSALGDGEDLERIVQDLVTRSNAAGGVDNVTVVLIDVLDVAMMRAKTDVQFGGASAPSA
jgi:protein phosphatase